MCTHVRYRHVFYHVIDKLIEASSYVNVKLDNLRWMSGSAIFFSFFIPSLGGLSLVELSNIDGLGAVAPF